MKYSTMYLVCIYIAYRMPGLFFSARRTYVSNRACVTSSSPLWISQLLLHMAVAANWQVKEPDLLFQNTIIGLGHMEKHIAKVTSKGKEVLSAIGKQK